MDDTHEYKFAKNCNIAYQQILSALEDGDDNEVNQILSAVGILLFKDKEYQIQLVINSEKESWVGTNDVAFCKSETTGFISKKEFDS